MRVRTDQKRRPKMCSAGSKGSNTPSKYGNDGTLPKIMAKF